MERDAGPIHQLDAAHHALYREGAGAEPNGGAGDERGGDKGSTVLIDYVLDDLNARTKDDSEGIQAMLQSKIFSK